MRNHTNEEQRTAEHQIAQKSPKPVRLLRLFINITKCSAAHLEHLPFKTFELQLEPLGLNWQSSSQQSVLIGLEIATT